MADINEVPEFQNYNIPTSNMVLEYPEQLIDNDNIQNGQNGQIDPMNPMNQMDMNFAINSNYSNYQNFTDNLYRTSFNELGGSPEKIMKIRKEFNDYLINNFTEKLDINNDEEMKKTIVKIDEALQKINEVMELFDGQQLKVMRLEKELDDNTKAIEKDTEIINDFSSFTEKVSSKYNGIDSDKITECILEICDSIKKNSGNLGLKKEYQKELYVLKYLFHHFIKKINQGNIGSTCSMCMNNQVNTFLEPCGHTCCEKCIERYLDNGNNSKCFICREIIFKKHKLYFI